MNKVAVPCVSFAVVVCAVVLLSGLAEGSSAILQGRRSQVVLLAALPLSQLA